MVSENYTFITRIKKKPLTTKSTHDSPQFNPLLKKI